MLKTQLSQTEIYLLFNSLIPRDVNAQEILDTLSVDTNLTIPILQPELMASFENLAKESTLSNFFFELIMFCRDKSYAHPDWCLLAGRIKTLQIKKVVPDTFLETLLITEENLHPEYFAWCVKHHAKLQSIIDYNRDWSADIFAIETLTGGYLFKVPKKIDVEFTVETQQAMYLRVAIYLKFPMEDPLSKYKKSESIIFEEIKVAYDDFSLGKISLPTPMLARAGSTIPQLASCYLMDIEDNMDSIAESWRRSALFSKNGGGLGITYDAIRHSEISNTGMTQGITPWIRIQDNILKTVDQGGLRKGSGTMFTCIWHKDIFEFIDLKNPIGDPELRAKNSTYGIMIHDLFMERVREDKDWSLFCPAKTESLEKTYGREFNRQYLELEKTGLTGVLGTSFTQVKARDLWKHILTSQIERGMPFICYKDSINRKSCQQNLGTIRTSNLCVEIVLYVDKENLASCNLSSIPVSKFVEKNGIDGTPCFNFEELGNVTRRALHNLVNVINRTYYPKSIPEVKKTNFNNRPIGIGIQDLAGCFALMGYTWDSPEARKLNEEIARTMYYHGMDENTKLAKKYGYYKTFPSSPASKGLFQFDLWTLEKMEKLGEITLPLTPEEEERVYPKLFSAPETSSFNKIRENMINHGLYFSNLFAQMPTASSAHILGNNEAAEPYTQLIGARKILKGQFILHNRHLVRELEEIGLWSTETVDMIIKDEGSIANLQGNEANREKINYIKEKYKIAFELKQKIIADMYLSRAKYQCQTSSNNVWFKNPTLTTLNAYHFYMWENGAKTGMYYLRSSPAVMPLNFSSTNTVAETESTESIKNFEDEEICTMEEGCLSCGS